MSVLAHALPASIGAVPLTLVMTAMLGAYLAVGAITTRRGAAEVARRTGGGAGAGRVEGDAGVEASADAVGVGNLIGVAGLVLVALLASAGAADASTNLTDQAVVSLLWGAVALSSILLGGWWARVDPLRALSAGLARATGDPEQHLAQPGAPLVTTAAAVVCLLAWAWVQLLTTPSVVMFQVLLIAYLAVHLVAALRAGPRWLAQAESLHVVSATMGLLRPTGGGPLSRLSAIADEDRLRWICGALIGWSLTDLITETEQWHDLPAATAAWVGPVLLIGSGVGLFGLIRAVSARFRLGPAFVAVAAGWVVAQYLSILIIEGQGLTIWLSDPFATGADLLGRRGDLIDLEPVPLWVLAALQSIPFIAGHLLAVAVVQRRAAAAVRTPGQLGPATFFARALIAVLLLAGTWLQLGGV